MHGSATSHWLGGRRSVWIDDSVRGCLVDIFSIFDRHRWVADADLPGRQIFERASPCTQDSPTPDCDAWSHKRIGSDPHIVFNYDRRSQERHIRPSVIMTAGANVSVLTDCNTGADRHAPQTIKSNPVADARIRTNQKMPRNFNLNGATNMSGRMYLGAKSTQKPGPPTIKRPRAESKDRRFC